ncbi:MAG: hypothetical protein RLZZ213_932, partial [Cyanobacteriota bacterium]
FPLLREVAQARGAQAVLDSRAVLLASTAIDVTDTLIARVDG